jgi:hypothetical protein
VKLAIPSFVLAMRGLAEIDFLGAGNFGAAPAHAENV